MKNLKVIDVKPLNDRVLDAKPSNKAVIEEKSKNQSIFTDFGTEQYYTVVLGAGAPMGLLLSLTYPTSITIQSSFSP